MSDNRLIENLQQQMDRLLHQLADIETERSEISTDEYEDMKKETIEQLQELGDTLEKMEGGSISTIDSYTTTKMAIRAAISSAFRTPEVLSLLARRQPALLRQRLGQLEVDKRVGRIQEDVFQSRKAEMLLALERLGDPLSAEEVACLAHHEQELAATNESLVSPPLSTIAKSSATNPI